MRNILSFLNENIEKIICVMCLSIMSVLIVVQVIFRYALNNSLSWSEEIARYLFIWLIYVGISLGVKTKKHIAVEAIAAMAPERARKYFDLCADILFLIFVLLALFYGTQVIQMIAESGQLSPAAHIPMQLIYAAPVIGFFLTLIRLVQNLTETIRKMRHAKEGN